MEKKKTKCREVLEVLALILIMMVVIAICIIHDVRGSSQEHFNETDWSRAVVNLSSLKGRVEQMQKTIKSDAGQNEEIREDIKAELIGLGQIKYSNKYLKSFHISINESDKVEDICSDVYMQIWEQLEAVWKENTGV